METVVVACLRRPTDADGTASGLHVVMEEATGGAAATAEASVTAAARAARARAVAARARAAVEATAIRGDHLAQRVCLLGLHKRCRELLTDVAEIYASAITHEVDGFVEVRKSTSLLDVVEQHDSPAIRVKQRGLCIAVVDIEPERTFRCHYACDVV